MEAIEARDDFAALDEVLRGLVRRLAEDPGRAPREPGILVWNHAWPFFTRLTRAVWEPEPREQLARVIEAIAGTEPPRRRAEYALPEFDTWEERRGER
jgi:hypothetical protein